jgi:hypothetical protein
MAPPPPPALCRNTAAFSLLLSHCVSLACFVVVDLMLSFLSFVIRAPGRSVGFGITETKDRTSALFEGPPPFRLPHPLSSTPTVVGEGREGEALSPRRHCSHVR